LVTNALVSSPVGGLGEPSSEHGCQQEKYSTLTLCVDACYCGCLQTPTTTNKVTATAGALQQLLLITGARAF
jgi:hypothetical protein